jgi:hypothetical protein
MKSTLFPVSIRGILASVLLLGAAISAHAATAAKGTISNSDLGGGLFRYTITLSNVGTTSIETFWYAWNPGQDFLATSPSHVGSPTGWSATITGGGPSDGFAIEWETSSAPLAPGGSATFTFESTDTPDQIAGNSIFFPSTPVNTSIVYEGGPFVGGSDEFVVGAAARPGAPAIKLNGPTTFSTDKSKITVRGETTGGLSSVTYQIGSHSPKPATGTAKWHFTVTLKKGKNVILIVGQGSGGASARARLTVTRS